MKTLLVVTGAIAASFWISPARASHQNDPLPTIEVAIGDLNLTRVNDQLRLRHRLSRAASVLCKEVDNAMPVASVDPVCYRITLQHAVQQMDWAIAHAESTSALAVAAPRQ